MLLDLGDLKVRSWRKDDLKALVLHANNPKIAANLRDQFPHPYTRRDAIDFLDYAQIAGAGVFVRHRVRRRSRWRSGISDGTRHCAHQRGDGLLAERGILGARNRNACGRRPCRSGRSTITS